MKKHLGDAYIIAEELDNHVFGDQILEEALDSIEWHQLFQWYDSNWLHIAACAGVPEVNQLSFELLWATVYRASD